MLGAVLIAGGCAHSRGLCSFSIFISLEERSDPTLAVPLYASDVFNGIHHAAGFLYGIYSRRFRYVSNHVIITILYTNEHAIY